jgi:rhamnose transport system substrate-binding protein
VARLIEFLFVSLNERCPMLLTRGRRARRVAVIATAVAIVTVGTTVAAQATSSLKKGLTVFYIPKDTLNPYEVIADRGGKIALTQMGSKQVVQSGTKDTAAAQLPAVQTAIQTGANAIVIAGNDPAALCPQLKQAMAKGVAVVTFDSDTNCRQLFINQADTETIGRSQIQELGKEMGYKGEFAILSAASTATNQNAWIKYMKLELKKPKYKNMKLVKIYYGNDDPAESLQATESMLQAYPNLKGIESPTTVGISSAAQYLSNSKYKGKVVLQGLGLPSQMKKYLKNDTLKNFALWNPEDLGYLAAYAAASLASGDIKGKIGETFKAGKLGSYKIIKGAGGPEVILGPPFLFTKQNVDKFKF